ncbi:unnamed protein product [Protopolystoma xenopodis]|uniref:Uncharacterized protein n=1 Tax=Protopolystoma xenopodis TaxID=117903 RepID=A0A3S5BLK2_9PLAT|nr:unnamed protein product [Protopolystoma xenopodis]
MIALTDDADCDAVETFGNVPNQWSDAGNPEYYGRYVPQRFPDVSTKLGKRDTGHSLINENSIPNTEEENTDETHSQITFSDPNCDPLKRKNEHHVSFCDQIAEVTMPMMTQKDLEDLKLKSESSTLEADHMKETRSYITEAMKEEIEEDDDWHEAVEEDLDKHEREVCKGNIENENEVAEQGTDENQKGEAELVKSVENEEIHKAETFLDQRPCIKPREEFDENEGKICMANNKENLGEVVKEMENAKQESEEAEPLQITNEVVNGPLENQSISIIDECTNENALDKGPELEESIDKIMKYNCISSTNDKSNLLENSTESKEETVQEFREDEVIKEHQTLAPSLELNSKDPELLDENKEFVKELEEEAKREEEEAKREEEEDVEKLGSAVCLVISTEKPSSLCEAKEFAEDCKEKEMKEQDSNEAEEFRQQPDLVLHLANTLEEQTSLGEFTECITDLKVENIEEKLEFEKEPSHSEVSKRELKMDTSYIN